MENDIWIPLGHDPDYYTSKNFVAALPTRLSEIMSPLGSWYSVIVKLLGTHVYINPGQRKIYVSLLAISVLETVY